MMQYKNTDRNFFKKTHTQTEQNIQMRIKAQTQKSQG